MAETEVAFGATAQIQHRIGLFARMHVANVGIGMTVYAPVDVSGVAASDVPVITSARVIP